MRKKLTKGIISFIVTLAMIAALMPVIPAMADSGVISDTEITWEYDDSTKTLTVSGAGAIPDRWWENAGDIRVAEVLIIEEGITNIGDSAFENSGLKSVTLPKGLLTIGNRAFAFCSSLSEVKISEGTTSIGESAFAFCGISVRDGFSIILPISINHLGANVFQGNKDGCYVYYAGSAEDWEAIDIDEENSDLSETDILYSSTGITWHIDPQTGILYIDGQGCMPNFTLGAPWTYGNTLEEYYGSNDHIDGDLIKGAVISEGVTSVGANAFVGLENFESVDMPDTITSIGHDAFYNCSKMANVDIPDGVTEIGDRAFYHCNKLTSVVLPSELTRIGESAFEQDRWSEDGIYGISRINLPSKLVSIGSGAFESCDLRSITIPASVKEIGLSAFENCDRLASITFSPGASVVGEHMFYYCDAISNVTLPASITEIGAGAFESSSLTSIDLPDGLEKINASVFANCQKLSEIDIPSSVTEIGEKAFMYCYSLDSVTVPGNVKKIGMQAFANCSTTGLWGVTDTKGLTNVVISEGVTEIDRQAFENCDYLTSVDLPSSLETIGNDAFSGCTALNTVYYEGELYANGAWDEVNIGVGNEPLTNLTPSEKVYKLTYDTMRGTGTFDQATARRGENFTVTDTAPTRAGYNFLGWTDIKNGREVKYEAGDTIEAYYDITLYAVWSADFVVSIPDEDLSPKIYDTVSIPVSVTDNKGFATLMLSVKYDKTKFELAGADVGALAPGAAVTTAETADGANIMIVSNSDIKGSGEVVTVKLTTTVETLNASSDITVTPIQARNTANPNDDLGVDAANDTESVVLTVSGDATNDSNVDSGDVLVMSRYCAQYQNHGMTSEGNADVYTDGIVNIKDVYVLSQYVTAHPSLSSISLMNAPIMPVNTDKPEIKCAVAKVSESDKNYIDVTVSVENNTGFTGFNFVLGFDKTKLSPVRITNGALTSEALVSNMNESGVDLSSLDKVTAFWIGSAVMGDGDLYTVRFEELATVEDDEQITFERDGFTNGVDDINALFPSAVTVGGQNIKEELDIVFDTDTVRVTGDASGQLIVAGYDENGNLVKAIAPQGYEQPLTEFADCDSVKAFLWNSLSGMAPVCESKSK